jgi:hypothetical protein
MTPIIDSSLLAHNMGATRRRRKMQDLGKIEAAVDSGNHRKGLRLAPARPIGQGSK